jgi:nucleotide-binding universal stress UspA family protein
MFKDLLVPLTGAAGDADAIRVALALAAKMNAHVAFLEMVNLPMLTAGPWGLPADENLVDTYRELRARGARNAADLKARLAGESVSTEVRLVESLYHEPHRVAAHVAHYADIAVLAVGTRTAGDAEITHAYVGSLLVDSGRPLIAVPPDCKATMPPQRIVAAWKPTSEAARAFHDALPFFLGADMVDILVIDPAIGERGHGEQPGADIATHLTRHGVRVNVVVAPAGGDSVSSAINRHAAARGADMIVAGGYGHSRFREWALGGATRELLESAKLPILFSH